MDDGKRYSILKPSKLSHTTVQDNNDEDDDSPIPTPGKLSRTSRRVSFASSNLIKEFAADPEKVTIWNETYEETIEKSDSSPSLQNTLCFQTENLVLDGSSDTYEDRLLDNTMANIEVDDPCNKENITPQLKCDSYMDLTTFVPLQVNTCQNMNRKTLLYEQDMDLTCLNTPKLRNVQTMLNSQINMTLNLDVTQSENVSKVSDILLDKTNNLQNSMLDNVKDKSLVSNDVLNQSDDVTSKNNVSWLDQILEPPTEFSNTLSKSINNTLLISVNLDDSKLSKDIKEVEPEPNNEQPSFAQFVTQRNHSKPTVEHVDMERTESPCIDLNDTTLSPEDIIDISSGNESHRLSELYEKLSPPASNISLNQTSKPLDLEKSNLLHEMSPLGTASNISLINLNQTRANIDETEQLLSDIENDQNISPQSDNSNTSMHAIRKFVKKSGLTFVGSEPLLDLTTEFGTTPLKRNMNLESSKQFITPLPSIKSSTNNVSDTLNSNIFYTKPKASCIRGFDLTDESHKQEKAYELQLKKLFNNSNFGNINSDELVMDSAKMHETTCNRTYNESSCVISVVKDKIPMELDSPVKNQTYTKNVPALCLNQTAPCKDRTYTKETVGSTLMEIGSPVKNRTYTKAVAHMEVGLPVKNVVTAMEAETSSNKEPVINENNQGMEIDEFNLSNLVMTKDQELSIWQKGINYNVKENESGFCNLKQNDSMQTSNIFRVTAALPSEYTYIHTPKKSITPCKMNFGVISPEIDDTHCLINFNLDKQDLSDLNPKSDFSKIIAGETPECMSRRFLQLGDFSNSAFPVSLENSHTRDNEAEELKRLTNSYNLTDRTNNISNESLELCTTIDETFTPIATATQCIASTVSTSNMCETTCEEFIVEDISQKLKDFQTRHKQRKARMDQHLQVIKNNGNKMHQIVKNKIMELQTLFEEPLVNTSSEFSLDSTLENVKSELLQPLPSNEPVLNKKIDTITEKIKNMHKGSKHWSIIDIKNNELTILTLYKAVVICISFNEETGIVNQIERTYKLREESHGHAHYALCKFKYILASSSIESAIGKYFNVFTFIHYICINMSSIVRMLNEFDKLEDKFAFKIDTSLESATFKIFRFEALSIWSVSLNIKNWYNMTPDCVTATALMGTVDETKVKSLVNNCQKGTKFFKDFIEKVNLLSYETVKDKS